MRGSSEPLAGASATAAIAFPGLQTRPGRKELTVTALKLARTYARYALSSLAVVAFGRYLN